MTNDQCRATCANKGFPFAGTQSGDFCFCGDNAGSFGLASQCGDVCGGRPGEACGGTLANSVSLSGASGLQQAQVPPPPANGGQCVINVSAPAYQHFEIQTWTVTGMPTVLSNGGKLYPMRWSVTGGGMRWDLTVAGNQTQTNKRSWTIDSTSPLSNGAPPVTAVQYQGLVLNGVMTFSEQSSQGAGTLLDTQQPYINGMPQTPTTLPGLSLEWRPGVYNFPVNPETISGTVTFPVDDSHPYGYARRPGATGTVVCRWNVTR
jgi:hypothetical protein